ncbi:hypothetical protein EJB05_02235, partial [Eragrostis curvula]
MAPSRHADEGGKLPLMDADRIKEEEEEDCFDSIDMCTSLILQSLPSRPSRYSFGFGGLCVRDSETERPPRRIASSGLRCSALHFGADIVYFCRNRCCSGTTLMRFQLGLNIWLVLRHHSGLIYCACASVRTVISQGINAGDVKKLQDAGIYTCNGLMKHTKKSLTGIKGLSEAKVEKIFEAAEKLLSQGFMTGSDLLIPSFEELKGTPEAEVEKICNAAKKLLASSSQADEGVEEDESFDSIDMLIYEGINSGNVKMLKDVGIYTCNGLMKKKKEDLTGIKGLSEANVEKIIEAADKLGSQGLKTGSNLLINSNTGSQAIDRDYVTNLSKQAMPPADAGTASRTSGSQSWGLLNRVVFFVDPDAVDPEGVDLDGVDPDSLLDVCIIPEPLVKTILPGGVLDKKIPEVSVVIMHGSILSGSSCCSITGLVKCTDPAGNILIEVSQGPGTERLFVCQPGSGTALRLPPVPDSLRIKNPTPYCTGIVSDQCGSSKDFVRPSTASSGSTNLLQALCFASSEETWRLKDLKADRLSRFEAKTVISHSDGSLVFMDLDYGMLIFDPTKEDVVRVVPFPEGTRKYHSRCVATSEGRLWHVLVDGVPYDPKVTMWWFDKESEWKERVCIGMDEVWSLSDYKDANLPVEASGQPTISNMEAYTSKQEVTVMKKARKQFQLR